MIERCALYHTMNHVRFMISPEINIVQDRVRKVK